MSQGFWTGLIVAAAALYLLWRWLPARWRQRVTGREQTPASGCGSCSSCAGCAAAGTQTSAPAGLPSDAQADSGGKPTLARARWQASLPSSNSRQGDGRHS